MTKLNFAKLLFDGNAVNAVSSHIAIYGLSAGMLGLSKLIANSGDGLALPVSIFLAIAAVALAVWNAGCGCWQMLDYLNRAVGQTSCWFKFVVIVFAMIFGGIYLVCITALNVWLPLV